MDIKMNFHGGDIYSCQGEVLDFSSNINPLGIPESFRRTLWEKINDFTRYPDIKYRALKSELAQYLGLDRPDMVIPGNGAVEIIFKTIMALQCSRLIIFSPTFSEYARSARQSGIEVVDIDGYDEGFGELDFAQLFDVLKPNSLLVLCNPNNPTGTFVEREKMCFLARELAKKNCYLLIDEAFIEFTDDYPENSMVGELGQYSNIIIIRAATKFFGMPGVRLGFGVSGNNTLLKGIAEHLEPWNVNTAAVLAGCTVYRDQDYIRASREWVKKERKFLFDRLSQIDGLTVYPSKANYHLAKISRETIDAWQLKDLMLEKGILIRTPDGFNYLSPYHFRLAVKDRESNQRLIETLREVLSLHGA